MTRTQLADYLGLSTYTVRNWVASGKIRPSMKTAKRHWWSKADADAIRRRLGDDGDAAAKPK